MKRQGSLGSSIPDRSLSGIRAKGARMDWYVSLHLDTVERDADGHALVRPVRGMGRSSGDSLKNVVALDELAEGGVNPIELARAAMANEELAPSRIRITRPGHRNDATVMVSLVELSLDFIARITGPPTCLLGRFLG